MDLTTSFPRSPRAKLAGLVMLARTTDKARAHNEGTPGPYHYGCGMDRHVLSYLDSDPESFATVVASLGADSAIENWAKSRLTGKSNSDIASFNAEFAKDGPEPGSDSERFYEAEQHRLQRDDIKTWFELLDVDEGRDVPHRAAA